MHSRIFGIIENNYYEKHKNDYDWKLDMFEYETPSFADYCSLNTDVNEDFMWLIEYFVNERHIDTSLFDIDDKKLTIKFKPGFKEAYFRKHWEVFIKNVIGDPNAFERFCGINDNTDFVYRCKKLFAGDDFGFYVSDEYGSYEVLDDFIRRVKYEQTYKCFASVDYHY